MATLVALQVEDCVLGEHVLAYIDACAAHELFPAMFAHPRNPDVLAIVSLPAEPNAVLIGGEVLEASLEHLGRGELVSVVNNLTRENARLKRAQTLNRKRVCREKTQRRKLEIKVASLETIIDNGKYIANGKKRKADAPAKKRYRLTIPGAYRLALKRMLGYASANSTAQMLDVPVTRWSVTMSENLLRASFWTRTRDFFDNSYAVLDKFIEAVEKSKE